MPVKNIFSDGGISNSIFEIPPLKLIKEGNQTPLNNDAKVPQEVSITVNSGDDLYTFESRAL